MNSRRQCTCENNFKYTIGEEYISDGGNGFAPNQRQPCHQSSTSRIKTSANSTQTFPTFDDRNSHDMLKNKNGRNVKNILKPIPLRPNKAVSQLLEPDDESSFVHLQLPSSSKFIVTKADTTQTTQQPKPVRYTNERDILETSLKILPSQPRQDYHEGFLDAARHLSALVVAGEGRLFENEIINKDASPLCGVCIESVSRSINESVNMLYWECEAYDNTVTSEENRHNQEEQQYITNGHEHSLEPPCNYKSLNSTSLMTEEMVPLVSECEELEKELMELNIALKEQQNRASALDREEDNLFLKMNCLEIDVKTYQGMNYDLASTLSKTQSEIEALSHVKLDTVLYDIVVNKYNNLYPTINGLRLAYRSKDDLKWNEINAAWSQAVQLLMLTGGMVGFTSRQFRIVPITTCAQIIEIDLPNKRKIVHHLGKDLENGEYKTNINDDMALSLRAFHSLLQQLLSFLDDLYRVSTSSNESSIPPAKPPHKMDLYSVGRFDLTRLQARDYASWQSAIYLIADNLKWIAGYAENFQSLNLYI